MSAGLALAEAFCGAVYIAGHGRGFSWTRAAAGKA